MKIERLLQFARLASYRSLNQASQDLFISHQGLSKLIQSLEKEFAASLVIRQSDGIVLTREGQYLCQKAAEMAHVLGALENKLYHNSCQQLAGEVTIFLDELTYAKFFTKLLPYLQGHYPDLVFRVTVIDNLQYTADDCEVFLQTAKNSADSIGLFTFFALSDQPNITYPELTMYHFKNSELLLGCNAKEHTPFAEYPSQPLLILNERDFGQNNALTRHLAQKFEVITVKSQLQCVRALATANTYTVELADDIVSFPPFIPFASCAPPIIFQTYYMFFGQGGGLAQSLYSAFYYALCMNFNKESAVMNSQQLFYFVTTAQTRSIRQAAHLCHVSPAAVSLTLQNLSSEMKVPLYIKTSTSIELTEEGLLFYDAAVALLAILEESHRHFRTAPLNLSGNIQIAAVGGISPFILSFVLTELSLAFPNLLYQVHTMTREAILRQVALGQIDIGYFNLMPSEAANYRRDYPELTFAPLVLCDFVLMANKNHPLAPKRQLNSQDLKTYPLILYVHDAYQDNPLFAAFAKHTGQKIHFTKNTNYLTHMVMNCDYLTLMPYMNNKLSTHFFDIRSHVLFFPKKPLQYSTYFVYAKTAPKQSLLQDFIAYTRFFYHSQ